MRFRFQDQETLHSPIGASSYTRWSNCPGSVALSKQVGSQPSSFFAAQGTLAHAIVEHYLKYNKEFDYETVGDTWMVDDHEIEITEDMLEAVRVCLEFVRETAAHYGLKFYKIRTEIRFNLTHIDPDAFGTCDVLLYEPGGALHVIDYKHGAGIPVDIKGNQQLRYYASGALRSLTPEEHHNLSHIAMTIVQPRAEHPDGPIRTEVITLEDMYAFESELYEAVQRVRAGDPTLKPGEWCRFCPAKVECPGLKNEVMTQCRSNFAVLNKPQPPTPEALSVEELAKVMEHTSLIKNWLDSVKDHATDLVKQGVAIPGYVLVESLSNRKWVDETKAAETFVEILGTEGALEPPKLRSPAQIEKRLNADQMPLVDEHTHREVSGLKIAPESGKRKDVRESAKAALTALNL